jgi:hypothetical protein
VDYYCIVRRDSRGPLETPQVGTAFPSNGCTQCQLAVCVAIPIADVMSANGMARPRSAVICWTVVIVRVARTKDSKP